MAHPCRTKREKKQAHVNSWKEKVAAVLKLRDSKDPLRIKTKKKTYDYFLDSMPLVSQYKDFWIRKPEEWVAKSHNEDRQRISFLMWLFCKYKPPEFLFRTWLADKVYYKRPEYDILKDIFISWFIEIGQGASFQKISAEVLTKKEAHLFLQPPKIIDKDSVENVLIHIMWVKCKVRNLPNNICALIAHRFSDKAILIPRVRTTTNIKYNHFYTKHLLDFLSHYIDDPLLTVATLESILDFLANLTNLDLNNFSFKGRTLNSVIQLSNQWHYQQTQTKSLKKVSWPGLNIEDYTYQDNNNIEWKIRQLKTSTALLNEGRKLHHCVSSYVDRCISGQSNIFTMENDIDNKIATIEIDNNYTIVQISGPCNKKVTGVDKKMIERWAKEYNLKFQSWI